MKMGKNKDFPAKRTEKKVVGEGAEETVAKVGLDWEARAMSR